MADIAFTIEEACQVLDPPLSERQLRMIVKALGWQPDGHRYTGKSGHPASTYDAGRIMRLHSVLVPFMEGTSPASHGCVTTGDQ